MSVAPFSFLPSPMSTRDNSCFTGRRYIICTMRILQLFILILSARIVRSFVYSCEEVLYKVSEQTLPNC